MRVTLALVGFIIAIFVIQNLVVGFTEQFALTPAKALRGEVWQFVTYMFLHGDEIHIFLNLFVLFIFGITVEKVLGARKYLTLFFLAGIGSSVIFLVITFALSSPADLLINMQIPMLGASGAVFGIMAVYGFLYPRNWIIMFPGIPMPAIAAVFVFAGLEIFYGLTGSQPGIANWGHLGGILVGIIFILVLKYRKKLDEKKWTTKNQREFEFVFE